MTMSSPSRDFAIQVYRGADELGGSDLQFSGVLDKGKPVVLNFWAGQCPPCVAEMPTFQQLADEYEGRVLFVGIDVGPFTNLGTRDDALRLLNDLDVRYPTAAAVDGSSVKLYGVRAMPTTVFLARGGEIVNTTPGVLKEDQLRASLQILLATS